MTEKKKEKRKKENDIFRATIIKVLLFNVSDKIHNSQQNL
jgi:hypothetical protein